jgi:hypothetical protein
MTMRSLKAILAALCLAACGDQTPQTPSKAAPQPADWPAVDDGIPTAFQGVWAATAADCTKPAETRLEITADHLRFYESSGPVASVEATGPDEIRIVVSLSGEGAAAQRSFRYRLIDGGTALFDVRNGLERHRCPTA